MSENISAFPRPDVIDAMGCGIREGSDGMTLRDWFAGQCLSGVMAQAADMGSLDDAQREMVWGQCAILVWELADAMVASRGETA